MSDPQPDELPEFHVVVRHRNKRGPLGPYRLAMAVAFSMLVAGEQLLMAAQTGIGVDDALIRAALAAWFIWILAGVVSRILATAQRPTSRRRTDTTDPPPDTTTHTTTHTTPDQTPA